ncbi:MAG: M15 family metallopeptidase [Flammeovirgaceae bacterium]|nr:M15 family metallopeptidase [Flammeovirgaceae bacterium]
MRISFSLVLVFYFMYSNVEGQTDTQYLLGKFNPADDSRFVRLTSEHASGGALGAYLRRETLSSFEMLQKAADRDGIQLKIISATRNFDRQKEIWENKWNGKTPVEGKDISGMAGAEKAKLILRYSSMPGTSRHHWGTDFDLNDLNPAYWKSGEGLKIYSWLLANASRFGFCQTLYKQARQQS